MNTAAYRLSPLALAGGILIAACTADLDLGDRPTDDPTSGEDAAASHPTGGEGAGGPSSRDGGVVGQDASTPPSSGRDGGGNDAAGGPDGSTPNSTLAFSSANPFRYAIYPAAVWGADPNNVWAVAEVPSPTIFRFDGTKWTNFQAAGKSLNAVHGTSTLDAWTVGDDGYVRRWNGSAWLTPTPAPGVAYDLNAVFAVGANDVYVVGDSNVLHFNGATWSQLTVPAFSSGASIWATAPNDVWIGAFTTILHYDGVAWSVSASNLGTTVNAIWGSGPSDVWAVGNFGFVSHWDGAKWTTHPTGSPIGFVGVMGSAAGTVYALGSSGELATFHNGALSMKKIGSSTDQFESLWVSGDGAAAWAVGFGTIFRGRP